MTANERVARHLYHMTVEVGTDPLNPPPTWDETDQATRDEYLRIAEHLEDIYGVR